MFKKMPFFLLALISAATFLDTWIPLNIKQILYAVSLSLKSVIVFALPFLIFGLLFKTAISFTKTASKIILTLLGAICLSNFVSTLISYGVGKIAYQLDFSMQQIASGASSLEPAWSWGLPSLIGNDIALFSGLILGVVAGFWRPEQGEKIAAWLEKAVALILRGFIYVIPLFILGFIVKMNHDKVLLSILRDYAQIFFLIAAALFIYISFLYLVANRFQRKRFFASLKNMLPAAITGFGSMSSAAAMPLTLIGTEQNAEEPTVAKSVIPATVNIHLIGDCFAIPIFAFAVLKSFAFAAPDFVTYLVFALYFVMAKFSVAAVPGGGILVMLPILEKYLHFDASMLSLITALYILFDPVITSANVLGNGGFALLFSRIFRKKAVVS